MSEQEPLDEAIQLKLMEQPLSDDASRHDSSLDVARPTAAGLSLLAVPTGCVGLAYRISSSCTTLEAIAFAPEPQVKFRIQLTTPAVNIACSFDGRLIVVACMDGSLQCYNATSTEFSSRWILPNAHSHVVENVSLPVSSDRTYAATKAGPVHSLAFAPSGHALILADAGTQRLSIYNAAESSHPINMATSVQSLAVLSASWSSTTNKDDEYPFAVGLCDGSVAIMSISLPTGTTQKLSSIPALDQEDMQGFVATHLDWFAAPNNNLAIGYCRCVPHEDGDDDDEDDAADHDALLYIGNVSYENFQYSNATDLGEVVSFFSVPRNGRHVYFTSLAAAACQDTPLLFVASNVASEVGVVALSQKQVIDLQEGYGATCPTDDEDEFTFPVGLHTVRLPHHQADATTTSEGLLLASTDGSLSVFEISNQNDENAFQTPQTSVTHGVAALPAVPLEASTTTQNQVHEPPSTPPLQEDEEATSSPPAQEPAATAPAFGSGTAPVFGSGSTSGLTFGSGNATSFGSPAFGQPSVLGSGTQQQTTTTTTSSSVFGSSSSSATPAFGSGSSAPVFGASSTSGGGFAALAASSPAAPGFGSFSSDSPFGAFSKSGSNGGASSMVKPLFGNVVKSTVSPPAKTSPVAPPPAAAPNTPKEPAPKESATITTSSTVSVEKETPTVPVVEKAPAVDMTAAGATKAAAVFDSFDKDGQGTLPLNKFEDLMDELGEGIYGDEMDVQKAVVDPDGTNQVTRAAFISWYVNLLASADQDDSSLDTDEREERAQDKKTALEAFSSLSSPGEGGKAAIIKDDFPKLFEKLGSVYCEEEHNKTIKKLAKTNGKIYEDDFISWYMDWLYDLGDTSDEEDDRDDSGAASDGEKDASDGASGWGGIFADQTAGDTWQCEVCMVRNPATATACEACETPKPGLTAEEGSSAPASSAAAGSSIGSGGFSFGGGSTAPKVGGFSFGGGSAAPAPAPVTGGFSFGTSSSPASSATNTTSGASIGMGGFSFQTGSKATDSTVKPLVGEQDESISGKEKDDSVSAKVASTIVSDSPDAKKAGQVFDSFDKEGKGTLPLNSFEDMMEELGEGIHGDELDAQKALVDPYGKNLVARSAFVSWYVDFVSTGASDEDSLDTADREERVTEREKAKKAFSSLAKPGESGKPSIIKQDFPELFEKLGSVYCEDEHKRTFKKLAKSDGKIYEDNFVDWYMKWLFSDEEYDTSDDEDSTAPSEGDDAPGEGSSDSAGWGGIFDSQTDGDTWQCEVCMVRNPASATACVACETSRPGLTAEEGSSAPASSAAAAGSSIGSGGFSFGGGSTAPKVGGFSFGTSTATPATTGEASKAPAGGGFSFGGTSGTKTGGFSFGSAPAPAASTGFSFAGSKASTTLSEAADSEKDSSAVPSSKGSSGYPPMATKAPTPFGGGTSIQKDDSTSSTKSNASAYPPMSSKAPVPFGKTSTSSTSTKSASSSSYPPLSTKAPTPFGGNKANATVKGASSAYPPMASKAPTPFGGAKKTSTSASSKSSEASAFTPVSSKAPTPFGGGNKACTQPPAPTKTSSSAYPPMSSKAPVPFGGSKATVKAPSKPSGSFASPPTSTKDSSSRFSSSSATSKPSSGTAAFPPLSLKAPTPFSGGNKTSAPAPTKSFGTSSFPPMSSKAPTPFGGQSSSKAAQAPKPVTHFGGGKTSTTAPFVAPASTGGSSTDRKPAPTRADSPWEKTPASSDYESQFRTVVKAFHASISGLGDSRMSSSFGGAADRDVKFESDIENLVEEKESLVDSCRDLDRLIRKQKERSIFLLSRKTDIERQCNESRRLINIQARSQAEQDRLVETQPLDTESERLRRSLAVKAIVVNRSLELLEKRNSVLRGMCDVEDEATFDEPIPATERKNVLFEALTSSFRDSQLFEEEATRRSHQVSKYAESIPVAASDRTLTPSRSTRRSIGGRGSKHRLTPVALDVRAAEVNRDLSSQSANSSEKWTKIEKCMRRGKQRAPVAAKKLTRLSRIGTLNTSVAPQNQNRPGRKTGPSLLLSPTPLDSLGTNPIRQRGRVSFSSPIQAARTEWDIASTVDQEKVKGMTPTFPQRLNKVNASDASRDALSGFGTTPEKMEKAFQLKNRGTKAAGSSSGTTSSSTASPSKSSSSAPFPPMSAKAPTPFSTKSGKGSQPKPSSAYPPMSKEAPKPFGGNVFGGTKSSTAAKPPPVAPKSPPKSTETATQSSKSPGISLHPKTSIPNLSRSTPIGEKSGSKAPSSAFGNLKGLGDSLFSGDGSPEKSDVSHMGLNLGSPMTSTASSTAPKDPDYHKILVDFYSKHNPSKLNEADIKKTLEKYKGREVEMFGKLARKYNVPSPLDSPPTTAASAPTPPATVFGSTSAFGKTPVAPMPMSSSGSATSAFGSTTSASDPAPSSSPFGAPAARSNSIGQSQPFGQPSTAPSPSPFGPPATQQSSPFGQPLGSSPSPFGPPATQQSSPFGPPASQATATPASSTTLIGGRPPREVLTAFYQQYNPSKVNECDRLLEKYKGNEEHLFRNLAKKYNLDPSMFGIPAAPPAASAPFGQNTQSAFGSTTAGFGQPSTLGSGSTFGSPSAPGGHAFGSSSAMGGGQSTFGSMSGGQTTPFGGGAAQSTGGFGSLASGVTSGGFGAAGGAFGSGGATGNPFGAPRR